MRCRNIKPSFFQNELLAEVPHDARLTFIGLWCLADREGRLEDRPKRIKAELWPYHDVDIESILRELANLKEPDGSAACIIRYVVETVGYIEVVHFKKHQHCHFKEGASIIPAPVKHRSSTGQAPVKHRTRTSQARLDPGSLLLDPGSLLLDPGSLLLDPDISAEPSQSGSSTPVPLMVFPTTGPIKEWHLEQTHVDTLTAAYDTLDVLTECKHAQAWCVLNKAKRKTPRGMERFLNGWMERAANSKRGNNSGASKTLEQQAETAREKGYCVGDINPFANIEIIGMPK